MKAAMSLAALALLLAGLMVYIRFAPASPADWHIDLNQRPDSLALLKTKPNTIITLPNGAYVEMLLNAGQAQAALTKLDTTAATSPRTRRIAGDVASGRITWESRSLIWGFPDYTTAQITANGLTIFARQRFGSNDFRVNTTRLSGWLAQL